MVGGNKKGCFQKWPRRDHGGGSPGNPPASCSPHSHHSPTYPGPAQPTPPREEDGQVPAPYSGCRSSGYQRLGLRAVIDPGSAPSLCAWATPPALVLMGDAAQADLPQLRLPVHCKGNTRTCLALRGPMLRSQVLNKYCSKMGTTPPRNPSKLILPPGEAAQEAVRLEASRKCTERTAEPWEGHLPIPKSFGHKRPKAQGHCV